MSEKEHEKAEREAREKKANKSSAIVFATMILSLLAGIVYIVING